MPKINSVLPSATGEVVTELGDDVREPTIADIAASNRDDAAFADAAKPVASSSREVTGVAKVAVLADVGVASPTEAAEVPIVS